MVFAEIAVNLTLLVNFMALCALFFSTNLPYIHEYNDEMSEN